MNDHERPIGTRVDYYPPRLTVNAIQYLHALATHPRSLTASFELCVWLLAQLELEEARRDLDDLAHETLPPAEATLPRLPLAIWGDRQLAEALALAEVLTSNARDADREAFAFLDAVRRPILLCAAVRLRRYGRPPLSIIDDIALDVQARTLALRDAIDQ